MAFNATQRLRTPNTTIPPIAWEGLSRVIRAARYTPTCAVHTHFAGLLRRRPREVGAVGLLREIPPGGAAGLDRAVGVTPPSTMSSGFPECSPCDAASGNACGFSSDPAGHPAPAFLFAQGLSGLEQRRSRAAVAE